MVSWRRASVRPCYRPDRDTRHPRWRRSHVTGPPIRAVAPTGFLGGSDLASDGARRQRPPCPVRSDASSDGTSFWCRQATSRVGAGAGRRSAGRRRILAAVSHRRSTRCSSPAGTPRTISRGGAPSWPTVAAALRATGRVESVASFDPTHVRGVADPDAAGQAPRPSPRRPWRGGALNRPRSWGVPGLPVARLPVILDGDRRRPSDVVDAHAARSGLRAETCRPLAGRHDPRPCRPAGWRGGAPAGRRAGPAAHRDRARIHDRRRTGRRRSAGTLPRLLPAAPARGGLAALAREIARALGVAETPSRAAERGADRRLSAWRARIAKRATPVRGSRKASKGIETLLRASARSAAGGRTFACG